MNKEIGSAVLDEYFKLKEERAKEAIDENSTKIKVNKSTDQQGTEKGNEQKSIE